MAWRALQSGHMYGADYDPESQILIIQFNNGAVYRTISRVPQTVVDSFFQSGSPGSFFHAKIENVYGMVKIADGTTRSGRRSRRRY
jgi:hypothetical protein